MRHADDKERREQGGGEEGRSRSRAGMKMRRHCFVVLGGSFGLKGKGSWVRLLVCTRRH